MGLISILITGLFILLGSGYYFFGAAPGEISITNEVSAPSVAEILPRFEDIKREAENSKSSVEEKVAEVTREEAAPPPALPRDSVSVQEASRGNEKLMIENRLMSSGFTVSQQSRHIDTIVLHSSYDALGDNPYSVSGIIKEYTDYGVSAHYLIDRAGKIYRLVEDQNIAYHAGVSKMPDGRRNTNDFSIGIEIMNTKTSQYTQAQYTAVNDLIASLKKQYPIKFVVGHQDIAPDRKTDPWNFDWKQLQQ